MVEVKQHVSASAVLSVKNRQKKLQKQHTKNISSLFDPPQEDNFFLERNLQQQGYSVVAGLDEVGRGPLAGPVVAAAVVLPDNCHHSLFLDSKKLSPKKRQLLFDLLHEIPAHIGIGIVSHKIIDKINILQASLLAMKRGVNTLKKNYFAPDFLLVDGKFPVRMRIAQQPLIKGEGRSASIAAASIIAKVTRDRIMAKLHDKYPQYNFKQNQGYPTKEHRHAVETHGICPHHRLSFRGVKEFV
ncbi:MAG: ribonuclease HII [Desulfocapsa sp.]|uniref:Ribonuclease HII n=1 Tax=Desulfotalea psychrophila TaxID=84980 RepID=A0ABS3AVL3_9BACT|nr:ribonuclease HII [Desulfocapsa sp.]MBN4068821.1 ribonuclease HII [Desulfotalea psychrophila]